MSGFSDYIRNMDINRNKAIIVDSKAGLEQLIPKCDLYVDELIELAKKQIMEKAKKGEKSYTTTKTAILNKIEYINPRYEISIPIVYCFDGSSSDFRKQKVNIYRYDFYENCEGIVTHSPELIIYMINEIERKLKKDEIYLTTYGLTLTPSKYKQMVKKELGRVIMIINHQLLI